MTARPRPPCAIIEANMKKKSLLPVLAALLFAGCATEHYMTDKLHPEIRLTADGGVTYRGKFVDPEDLPGLLKDSGLEKDDTIYIYSASESRDWRLERKVMSILSKRGFPRPIIVEDRKATSTVGRTAEERRRDERRAREQQRRGPDGKIRVRYKN